MLVISMCIINIFGVSTEQIYCNFFYLHKKVYSIIHSFDIFSFALSIIPPIIYQYFNVVISFIDFNTNISVGYANYNSQFYLNNIFPILHHNFPQTNEITLHIY